MQFRQERTRQWLRTVNAQDSEKSLGMASSGPPCRVPWYSLNGEATPDGKLVSGWLRDFGGHLMGAPDLRAKQSAEFA